MTTDEYRTILAEIGLTQSGAARLLGVDPRTSRKWACGERDIPEPAARFLRLILAAKISPERAMKLLSGNDRPQR